MPEYLITTKELVWQFEPDDFLRRIRQRWPNARTGMTQDHQHPATAEALIPFDPPRRELGVALSSQGSAIHLDPADPGTAAEFAVWIVTQLPVFEPVTYLFTINFMGIPLGPHATEGHIRAALHAPVAAKTQPSGWPPPSA